ncbi:hypothetical protein PR048_031345 [Dryococelus australis]|uniref:Uncharacterized protein n=1 Tax=Dryococelus australis TaxID=614101 RepID=A0ABQ9G5Q8_9NEOP|nr:hypothetical protein PR048_031345 [Dryococelus australis]
MPMLTVHWLYDVTVAGYDWASVLQEISNIVCTSDALTRLVTISERTSRAAIQSSDNLQEAALGAASEYEAHLHLCCSLRWNAVQLDHVIAPFLAGAAGQFCLRKYGYDDRPSRGASTHSLRAASSQCCTNKTPMDVQSLFGLCLTLPRKNTTAHSFLLAHVAVIPTPPAVGGGRGFASRLGRVGVRRHGPLKNTEAKLPLVPRTPDAHAGKMASSLANNMSEHRSSTGAWSAEGVLIFGGTTQNSAASARLLRDSCADSLHVSKLTQLLKIGNTPVQLHYSGRAQVPDGAAVAERLACLPPTKAIRVQSPAGSLRIFARGDRAGRCRWSTGLLGCLLGRCSMLTSVTLVGSQDLDVKSRPNLLPLHTGAGGDTACPAFDWLRKKKKYFAQHAVGRSAGSLPETHAASQRIGTLTSEESPRHYASASLKSRRASWECPFALYEGVELFIQVVTAAEYCSAIATPSVSIAKQVLKKVSHDERRVPNVREMLTLHQNFLHNMRRYVSYFLLARLLLGPDTGHVTCCTSVLEARLTVLCTKIPMSIVQWLSVVTVEGNDWASVVQEVSITMLSVFENRNINNVIAFKDGTAVAERLTCSNQFQSPVGSLPDFRMWEFVPDDTARRRVFSGISRFPRPSIPALLHTHLYHPRRLSRPRC